MARALAATPRRAPSRRRFEVVAIAVTGGYVQFMQGIRRTVVLDVARSA